MLWQPPSSTPVSPELLSVAGGDDLLAAILARRGFTDPDRARAFLDPNFYSPASPWDLPGMQRAVERLARAIHLRESILVWGDFDVDGQTATTTLVSALTDLGANVGFYIPHRERESHGVLVPSLSRLLDQGYSLVLTCDTGTGAVEAAQYARSRGVDFLVTDHHELPAALPDAHVLLNPHFLPAGHPLETLPGVGVAYQLVLALYQFFERTPPSSLLELVALGIVADVATQVADTRYLLQRGLFALRSTQNLGLLSLYEFAGFDPRRLTEGHIGFEIAPRLNALGRLNDANVAVEFFTTTDPGRARLLASHLEGLNSQRRLLTNQVYQGVLAQAERDPDLLAAPVLIFDHPDWPGGVLGLVAGQLAATYHKPAILFTSSPTGIARGSARSIQGLNITAALAENRKLLRTFGGHAMAAGLSLDTSLLPDLRRSLANSVSRMLPEPAALPPLAIDAELPLASLTLGQISALEALAPFGEGNPQLVFLARSLSLQSSSTIGRTGDHLSITVSDDGDQPHRILFWRGAGSELPAGTFDLAYTARPVDFRGQSSVQIEWLAAYPHPEKTAELRLAPPARVVDLRASTNPLASLRNLGFSPAEIILWSEGGLSSPAPDEFPALDRTRLHPAPVLVIWTTPASQAELRQTIGLVSPHTLILVGRDPDLDAPDAFLTRLAGLVKYTLRARHGQVELTSLAAALAARPAAVLAGLDWLSARGQLAWRFENGETLHLTTPAEVDPQAELSAVARLRALLGESRAYRSHFSRVAPESVTDL